MKNFDTVKDLQVTLDKDRPGTLAKATTAIANAGINIEGFCELDGQFHIVTSDPTGAKRALESAGYKVRETDVVVHHRRRDQRQRGLHAGEHADRYRGRSGLEAEGRCSGVRDDRDAAPLASLAPAGPRTSALSRPMSAAVVGAHVTF